MTRPPQRSLAGVASALGGYVMIGGSLLPWLDTGGVNIGEQVVSGTPAGIETTAGPIALVSGIVVLLAATLILTVPRASKVWALAVLLAGVVGMIAAVQTLTDPRDAYVRFAASEVGRDAGEVEHSLNALFDIGGIREGLGVGLYFSLAGGGLSVIAGGAGLVTRRRHRAHLPKRVVEHVETTADIPKEPPDDEPARHVEKETATAVDSEKREPPASRSGKADEEPAAPAVGKSQDRPPPPDDVDMWR